MAEAVETSIRKQVRCLVTGAGAGIGAACVDRLVAAGWHVYAGVRQPAHAAALLDHHGGSVTPLSFDVTDEAAVAAAGERIVAECGAAGLDGLVDNAGIAVAGPLEFVPPAELRRQLDVNVVGQVAVAQAVLPALRRAGGRIVLLGSIAGRSALPFMGPYSASKFALEAIADSWRIELRPWGVAVVLVEPGMAATPIWETAIAHAEQVLAGLSPRVWELYGPALAGMRRRAGRGRFGMPAEVVADVVVRALTVRRPRARYLVGRHVGRRRWLECLPTGWRDRLVAAGLRRL